MTPYRPSYAAGVAYAAAGAVCWSLGGALVRLTDGIDAWQIIFYRSIAVLVFMGLWLGFRFRGALVASFVQAGSSAVIAGVAVGTAGLSFIASLFYTTVAQSIFMVGISPFLSAILGLWILRERIPPVTWLAMIVAACGMSIIFAANAGGGSIVGTLLAIYSAFCFSCYAVLLRWGQKAEMSTALIWNAIYLILVAAIVILFPTGLRENAGIENLAIGWRNAAVIGLMGTVQVTLGLILFTVGSRSVPAAQLSLIGLIEPALSPLWAWLVASELPPLLTFAGGSVILIAIAIQSLFRTSGETGHAARRSR